MSLFGLAYDIALHLYALVTLPKIALAALKTGKYRSNFKSRLGFHFPKIEKGEKPLVWIHAVSMGETKAVIPLAKKLKPHARILLSTTTETGHAEGKKSFPEADWHLYLPFDFRYIIRPILKRTRPDLVILTETDFWYHFQDAAKKEGAQICLVNGKISEKSFHRLARFPWIARKFLGTIDHFFVQSSLYQKRFEALGVASEAMTVTGNLKFDGFEEEANRLKRPPGPILTLGSTHDPEEKIWVEALQKIWETHPDLKVFFVPRHPERFDAVASLLKGRQISFGRWSETQEFGERKVLLVDAMGVLRQCYQVSDLAFVGGSLTPHVGGHNILEPGFYGKPVLFGPYMHAQPDLLDLVQTYRAGRQVALGDLVPQVRALLENAQEREEMGRQGQKLISEAQGALEKTISPLLEKLGAC